jgi:hypothetical protein
MHQKDRPTHNSPTRYWDKGFLATDCTEKKPLGYYEFYEPSVDPTSAECDAHVDGTVIAYGHDDIKNLGHTMSDFMNVWTMTWLAKIETNVRDSHHLDA